MHGEPITIKNFVIDTIIIIVVIIMIIIIVIDNLKCNQYYLHFLGDSTDVKSEPASPDEDSSRAHFGKQASCYNIFFFEMDW